MGPLDDWTFYASPTALVVENEWSVLAPLDIGAVASQLERVSAGPVPEGVICDFGGIRYMVFQTPADRTALIAWAEVTGSQRFLLLQVATADDAQNLTVPPILAQSRWSELATRNV